MRTQLLDDLQSTLMSLYGLDVPHKVEDFLTTDRELARSALDGRESAETLLIRQTETDQALEVSLYLDRDLLQRLVEDDPRSRLHAGNMNDFCLALEGVSHFVCLSWKADLNRQVSLLELELQAEIDKYLATAGLFERQRDGRVPAALHRCLFDSIELAEDLKEGERRRYYDANRYAGKYCLFLQSAFLKANRAGDLVDELRQFYRLAQTDKIRRISAS
jgi:hypothetical protein